MSEDSNEESWNMGKAFLQRLDYLLTSCLFFRVNKRGLSYYSSIEGIHIEIFSKLKGEEIKYGLEYYSRARNMKNIAIKNNKQLDFDILLEWELFLRGILEKRGMLTPRKEDSGL